jgi:hypothetical protein
VSKLRQRTAGDVLPSLWREAAPHFFVEHLLFAFHFLSFTFLLTVLLRPLSSALGINNLPTYLMSAAVVVVYFSYLFLALRRVYQQGTGLTLLKGLLSYVVTQFIIVVTQVTTLVVAVAFAARS